MYHVCFYHRKNTYVSLSKQAGSIIAHTFFVTKTITRSFFDNILVK